MAIQPTPSGRPSQLGSLNEGAAAEATRRGPAAARKTPADAADRVELSPTARELSQASGAETVPAGALDPARLREVLARVGQGFYDRPEVRDAVVLGVARDL